MWLGNAAPTPQECIEFVDYAYQPSLREQDISAIVEEMGKVDEVKAITSMLHARQKTAEMYQLSSKCLQRVL